MNNIIIADTDELIWQIKKAIKEIMTQQGDFGFDEILTTQEAAKMLKLKPTTLYKNKQIPFCKIDGARRYRNSDIYSYLKANSSKNSLKID